MPAPLYFTQPQLIEELFALAGEPINDYFGYEKLQVSCNYFFENGKQVTAFADREKLCKEIAVQLGESTTAVEQYLNQSQKLYNNIGPFFLDHSLHKRSTFFKKGIGKAIAASRFSHLFRSLNQYNQSHFKSAEAVQLFNRFATYNGSNPYKAPGMLGIIPHLEMNEGSYYPKGGMISITNALFRLAVKKGVQFRFDTPVQRIIHHEGTLRGIVVNNENLFAGIVVSNADVYFTYHQLLQDAAKSKRLLKQERSSSALIFYWGIRKSFPQLRLHNIFFGGNYRKEFGHLFKLKNFATDLTVYINITAKMEATQAPPGCENWFVMINAPSMAGQNWASMQQQVRRQVIEKLNRMLQTDIEPLIQTETILTPPQIETVTASYAGSLYGTSSNSRLAAFWRHPNFSRRIKRGCILPVAVYIRVGAYRFACEVQKW